MIDEKKEEQTFSQPVHFFLTEIFLNDQNHSNTHLNVILTLEPSTCKVLVECFPRKAEVIITVRCFDILVAVYCIYTKNAQLTVHVWL